MIHVILIMSLAASAVHDFHVSISKIYLNPESKKLEVMIKLFTDDLSTTLDSFSGKKMNLGTQEEPSSANDELMRYVESGFGIKVNEKQIVLNYLGKEKEDDATWVYLESEKVGRIKSITVTNTLLIEMFDDQANLINLKVDGENEALTLRREQVSGTIKMD